MITAQRTDLAEWIREEQVSLWHELSEAIRFATNGVWSIKASNVARRIIEAARLVGPTGNGEIPWTLVAGGVYEAVLTAGGVSPEMPDEPEWQRLEDLMSKHGGTRATVGPQFAATVAYIKTPREQRWLNTGDE